MLDRGAEYFESSSLQFTQVNLNNKAKNVIPERLTTVGDMRFNDNWDKEKLRPILTSILLVSVVKIIASINLN